MLGVYEVLLESFQHVYTSESFNSKMTSQSFISPMYDLDAVFKVLFSYFSSIGLQQSHEHFICTSRSYEGCGKDIAIYQEKS